MIRETPGGDAIDPVDLQLSFPRRGGDHPWVVGNFVTTIDGAAVVDGGATGINDEDDIAMFAAMRVAADFVLVGAETVKAENYGPITLDERRRRARLDAGLEEFPHLVIASRSLNIEPGARVFSDPDHRPTILTVEDAPGDQVLALSEVADVVRLKDTSPESIVHYLRMAGVVLCEGGPSIWGQFIAARLVDEQALTVSPMLVSGSSTRMARGTEAKPPVGMRLDRVHYGDRSIFLRYLRA